MLPRLFCCPSCQVLSKLKRIFFNIYTYRTPPDPRKCQAGFLCPDLGCWNVFWNSQEFCDNLMTSKIFLTPVADDHGDGQEEVLCIQPHSLPNPTLHHSTPSRSLKVLPTYPHSGIFFYFLFYTCLSFNHPLKTFSTLFSYVFTLYVLPIWVWTNLLF